MGQIRSLLESNDIVWQIGELGRVDLGGGGTIAKYVANMNVDVIDLGVPVLSMHAPFEIVSKPTCIWRTERFTSFLCNNIYNNDINIKTQEQFTSNRSCKFLP